MLIPSKKLLKLLPPVASGGSFLLLSSCGCGHCPACMAQVASVASLGVYMASKKLLSSLNKGGKEGSGGEEERRKRI